MSASDPIAEAGRAAGQAAPPASAAQLQAASLLAGPVCQETAENATAGTDEEQAALAAHLEHLRDEAAEHTPAVSGGGQAA